MISLHPASPIQLSNYQILSMCLICTIASCRCFTGFSSLIPRTTLWSQLPFYRWGKWHQWDVTNLPEGTQQSCQYSNPGSLAADAAFGKPRATWFFCLMMSTNHCLSWASLAGCSWSYWRGGLPSSCLPTSLFFWEQSPLLERDQRYLWDLGGYTALSGHMRMEPKDPQLCTQFLTKKRKWRHLPGSPLGGGCSQHTFN